MSKSVSKISFFASYNFVWWSPGVVHLFFLEFSKDLGNQQGKQVEYPPTLSWKQAEADTFSIYSI